MADMAAGPSGGACQELGGGEGLLQTLIIEGFHGMDKQL